MLGNVWELTDDAYREYDEPELAAVPDEDHDPAQVIRGGSWIYGPAHVRCAFRKILSRTGRSYRVGFRIASNRIMVEGPYSGP